ncbi:MAG: glycosyltransferase [Acidobacteria bacterium]|nr:glycosyltransferase [Acidobacteriota bacterium]
MKVLQVGKYYFPVMGGMENHLGLLCGQLRGSCDLEIVVSHTKPRTTREAVDGLPVTRCLEVGHVASTSLCPTMPWVLSHRRYDLIHIHFPHPMAVVSYLLSRKPVRHKVVVTYHSDIVKQVRLLKLYAPFMESVLGRASAIICSSPDYIESSETLRKFRSKCRVIPLGIDLARFDVTPAIAEAAAKIRARFGGPVALGVGRLIYYKGFEHAVEAMRAVDGQLLIIGVGPLREALESRALACGVASRVHFLGRISDEEIASYYAACDVFILPSVARSEAFGLVQLEAMASRRPVINTSLDSGVPFVSRHGETGLTVEPASSAALASAMRTLFADPGRARSLGEAGRARAEAEFSKEVMGQRTRALYDEILFDRPRGPS